MIVPTVEETRRLWFTYLDLCRINETCADEALESFLVAFNRCYSQRSAVLLDYHFGHAHSVMEVLSLRLLYDLAVTCNAAVSNKKNDISLPTAGIDVISEEFTETTTRESVTSALLRYLTSGIGLQLLLSVELLTRNIDRCIGCEKLARFLLELLVLFVPDCNTKEETKENNSGSGSFMNNNTLGKSLSEKESTSRSTSRSSLFNNDKRSMDGRHAVTADSTELVNLNEFLEENTTVLTLDALRKAVVSTVVCDGGLGVSMIIVSLLGNIALNQNVCLFMLRDSFDALDLLVQRMHNFRVAGDDHKRSPPISRHNVRPVPSPVCIRRQSLPLPLNLKEVNTIAISKTPFDVATGDPHVCNYSLNEAKDDSSSHLFWNVPVSHEGTYNRASALKQLVCRAFVRVCGRVVSMVSRNVTGLSLLRQRGLVVALIGVFTPISDVPPKLCVELSQVIVHSLRVSVRLSGILLIDFAAMNGYSVFTRTLLYLEKLGEFKCCTDFVSILRKFIGVDWFAERHHINDIASAASCPYVVSSSLDVAPSASMPLANVLVVESLLYTFVVASSVLVQKHIVAVLSGFFDDHPANYERVAARVNVFEHLFDKFGSRHRSIQAAVLKLLALLIKEGHHLGIEIELYCGLLEDHSHPHAVLLVLQHMAMQLQRSPTCQKALYDAGIIPTLVAYLVLPDSLPFAPSLRNDEELLLSSALLANNLDSVVGVSSLTAAQALCRSRAISVGHIDHSVPNRTDLNLSNNRHVVSSVFDITSINVSLSAYKSLDSEVGNAMLYSVLQGINLQVLSLLLSVLDQFSHSQELFVNVGGLGKLCALVANPLLRLPALRVIESLGLTPKAIQWRVVPDLLLVLQRKENDFICTDTDKVIDDDVISIDGFSDVDRILMRIDVLQSIYFLMNNNVPIKYSFLDCGGFDYVASAIHDLCANISVSFNVRHERRSRMGGDDGASHITEPQFVLLQTLIRTLTIAATDLSSGLSRLRNSNYLSTLHKSLLSSRVIDSVYGLDFCEVLLDLSVGGGWPSFVPTLPHHRESLIWPPVISSSRPSYLLPGPLRLLLIHLEDTYDKHSVEKIDNMISLTFCECMRVGLICDYFRSFLNRCQPLLVSTLLFWLDAHQFRDNCEKLEGVRKKGISGSLRQRATAIFQKYIRSDAVFKVQLKLKQRIAIEMRLEDCPYDIFEDVAASAFRQLNSPDCFPLFFRLLACSAPFLKSPELCRETPSSARVAVPEVINMLMHLLASSNQATQLQLPGSGILVGKTSSVVCMMLREITYLARVSIKNRHSLTGIELVAVVHQLFYAQLQDENHSAHHLLLDLVHVLCAHAATKAELWSLLGLLRPRNFPLSVLQCLANAIEKRSPTYFLDFASVPNVLTSVNHGDMGSARMHLSNENSWPPTKGYSLSFWLRIHSVDRSSDEDCCHETCILSLEANGFQLIVGLENNTLVVGTGTEADSFVSFSSPKLDADCWMHIMLSHSRSKKKKKSGLLIFFINGVMIEEVALPYPTPVYAAADIEINSRSSIDLMRSVRHTQSVDTMWSHAWSLSHVMFFEESVTGMYPICLYCLGPDFCQPLSHVRLDHCNISDAASGSIILQHGPRAISEFLGSTDNGSQIMQYFQHLHELTVFIMQMRVGVVVHNVLSPQTSTSSGATIFFDCGQALVLESLRLVGDVVLFQCCGLYESAYDIGGIRAFIYLIAKSPPIEEVQCCALRLLFMLVKRYPQNAAEIAALSGFELLGSFLRSSNCVLGLSLVYTMFMSICNGVVLREDAARTLSTSNAIVRDSVAMQYLLLDWRTWSRTDESVQAQVTTLLVSLVETSNPFSSFNIYQLRTGGVLNSLLAAFQRHEFFPPIILDRMLRLFSLILHYPPLQDELEAILNFLVVTHPSSDFVVSQNTRRKPSLRSININRTTICTPTVDSSNTFVSDFLRNIDLGDEDASPVSLNDPRVGLINLLIELLEESQSENVLGLFANIFKMDILLALLHHKSIATRIALVKFLNMLLSRTGRSTGARFERMHGFQLLGNQLRQHDVSDELFSILYGMLDNSGDSSVAIGGSETVPVSSGNCGLTISVILSLMENCRHDDSLWHGVLHRLMKLFLEGDDIMRKAMLSNGLVDTLCNLIVCNLPVKDIHSEDSMQGDVRNHSADSVLLEQNNPSSTKTASASDSSRTSADRVNMTTAVLDFLEVIAVHACRCGGPSGLCLIDEIVVALARLEGESRDRLTSVQVEALQRAVLKAALGFFYQIMFARTVTINDALLTFFVSLCTMSVDHLLWSRSEIEGSYHDKMAPPKSSRRKSITADACDISNSTNESATISRGCKFGLRMSPFSRFVFKVLSDSLQRLTSTGSSSMGNMVDFLPFFAAQMALQSQLGRVVIYLLASPQPRSWRVFVVSRLAFQARYSRSIEIDTKICPLILLLVNRIHVELQAEFCCDSHTIDATKENCDSDPSGADTDIDNNGVESTNGSPRFRSYSPALSESIDDCCNDEDWFVETLKMCRDVCEYLIEAQGRSANRDTLDLGQCQRSPEDIRLHKWSLVFKPVVEKDLRSWESRDIAARERWLLARESAKMKRDVQTQKVNNTVRADSMQVTSSAISLQSQQNMRYIKSMKASLEQERTVFRNWATLIKVVTHERALWPELHGSTTWEINPTECVSRMRRRMQHCKRMMLYPTSRCKYFCRNSVKRINFEGSVNARDLSQWRASNEYIGVHTVSNEEDRQRNHISETRKYCCTKNSNVNDDNIDPDDITTLLSHSEFECDRGQNVTDYDVDDVMAIFPSNESTEMSNSVHVVDDVQLDFSTGDATDAVVTPHDQCHMMSMNKLLETRGEFVKAARTAMEDRGIRRRLPHLPTEGKLALLRQLSDELRFEPGCTPPPTPEELQAMIVYGVFCNRCEAEIPSSSHPLAYIFSDSEASFERSRQRSQLSGLGDYLKPGERIVLVCKASRITPFNTSDGEILVGHSCVYFVDEQSPHISQTEFGEDRIDVVKRRTQNEKSSPSDNGTAKEMRKSPHDDSSDVNRSRSWRLRSSSRIVHADFALEPWGQQQQHLAWPNEDILEIHKRRYLLKNNAMEIFLTNGSTHLLAFDSKAERDLVHDRILSLGLPNRVDYNNEVVGTLLRKSITQKWSSGMISTFDYLMHINTLAGRSFNDLTQYPVFPFVLADYTSEELDLNDPRVFRDFTMPIGAQDPVRLEKFKDKYDSLKDMGEEPYHYGSHYSNLGSVLHFLVRLEPFTQYFLEFQSGRFDIPDRTFHAIAQTWELSSSISNSDVKELTPEFFFLPEFLVNNNACDFGIKQDGQRVDDVILPPWAKGNPRLFILKNRQALESPYVSSQLHHWIDLIFGYKQKGPAAEKAFNLFHPLTYEGAVNVDAIEDHVQRLATIAQIRSYGQTPCRIFTRPHPARAQLPDPMLFMDPSAPSAPAVYWERIVSDPALHLECVEATSSTGSVIALGALKTTHHGDYNKYISWGYWDGAVRICHLDTHKTALILPALHDMPITCCRMVSDGKLLIVGHESGNINIWKIDRDHRRANEHILPHTPLYGHTASITCLIASRGFSVMVSGSSDSTCIIWDLNTFEYVRSLKGHRHRIVALAISPNTGDIVSASWNHVPHGENGDGESILQLCTINASPVGVVKVLHRIHCVAITNGMEGVCLNVVIAGLSNGYVHIWSTSDLSPLMTFSTPGSELSPPAAILSLALNIDSTELYVSTSNGRIISYGRPNAQRRNAFYIKKESHLITPASDC